MPDSIESVFVGICLAFKKKMWYVGHGFGGIYLVSRMKVEEFHM